MVPDNLQKHSLWFQEQDETFLWNITKAPLLKSTEWTETFIKDSKGLGRKPKKKEKTKKVYENKEKTKIKNPPQLFFLKAGGIQEYPPAALIIYYVVWKKPVDEIKDQLFLC